MHLDYCNSLLHTILQYQYDRLQKVLNAVTQVTCLIPKFAQRCITSVLWELDWLPVKFKVQFNIVPFFKTLKGMMPQYLSELLVLEPRTRYSLPTHKAKISCCYSEFHAGWRSSLFSCTCY